MCTLAEQQRKQTLTVCAHSRATSLLQTDAARLVRRRRPSARQLIDVALVCLFAAITACSPKQNSAPSASQTAYDLLKKSDFWTLAFADTFADGGSITLSFVNQEGEVIHVWAQEAIKATVSNRPFFLKRTYNDPNAVEIAAGSEIEKQVIQLLSSYQRRPLVTIPETYPKQFIAMLRDRKLAFEPVAAQAEKGE